MTLSPFLRWALAATLVAAAWLALQPDAAPAVAITSRTAAITTTTATTTATTSPMPERKKTTLGKPWPTARRAASMSDWPAAAAAAVTAWEPPPTSAVPVPKTVAAAASAAPEAPPFPYTLIGRLEEDGVSRALLAGATRTIDAKAGDLIDGQWRVESVRPDSLQLVWMPGGIRQTLNYRPA
jgi:hypothetical protein